MTWLAAGIALFWLLALLALLAGMRSIDALADFPEPEGTVPSVSVIVPARNEVKHIATAMRSLLELDYPDLQIIAVDDRSTDGTGDVLDGLSGNENRLQVVHVERLPEGWLGKLHAMQSGAAVARGELLLFADGDVHFEKGTLSRAITCMQSRSLDHLCCLPELMNAHWTLRPMIPVFSIFFFLHTRPWKVRDPASDAHIGVGAFNLLKRSTFDAIGGFEPIRLRPDDDLKLGKLVKMNGYRQDIVDGRGMLRVEWYHHAGEMIRGLEKNSFAVLDYSLLRAVLGIAFVTLASFFPFIASFSDFTPVRSLALATALLVSAISCAICHRQSLGWQWGLLFPLGAALMVIAVVNSTARTLLDQGIRWRGTFYPLELLRSNKL